MSRRLDMLVGQLLGAEAANMLERCATSLDERSASDAKALRDGAAVLKGNPTKTWEALNTTYTLTDMCEALIRCADRPLSLDEIARILGVSACRRRVLSTTLCVLQRREAIRYDRRTNGWQVRAVDSC